MKNKVEKEWYPSLNGLRAISITLVILNHLGMQKFLFSDMVQYKWIMPVIRLIQDGNLGVNIFFVISGFLITSLLLREEQQNQAVNLKKFYCRRTLRTIPAYYFLLCCYLLMNAIGLTQIRNVDFLTAFTFSKYTNWYEEWFTGHAWSLSVEEQFYLCWPLLFVQGDRFRKRAALFLFMLAPAWRIFTTFYPVSWMGILSLFWRIDAVATGCLLALYKDQLLAWCRPHWNKLFAGAVIALVSLRYIPPIATKIGLGFLFIPLGTQAFGTLANLLMGIILLYSVFGPRNYWFRFLNLKWMNFLGILSYSIYLWQQFFISGQDWWIAQYPQNLLCLAGAALFSYYFVEKPFLRLKERFAVTTKRQTLPTGKPAAPIGHQPATGTELTTPGSSLEKK